MKNILLLFFFTILLIPTTAIAQTKYQSVDEKDEANLPIVKNAIESERFISLVVLSIDNNTIVKSAATAKKYLEKYDNRSAQWQPDYVGTIQVSQTKETKNLYQQYTVVTDIELKERLHTSKPDPSASNNKGIDYEMRGVIKITSPILVRRKTTAGKIEELTCTSISTETPISISTGMTSNVSI
jgi:hypothetical protein